MLVKNDDSKNKSQVDVFPSGAVKASGVNKKSFCAEQAINIQTFCYWVTKQKQSQLASPGGFAAIDLGVCAEAGKLTILYPKGVQLSVTGASLPLIGQLIRLG